MVLVVAPGGHLSTEHTCRSQTSTILGLSYVFSRGHSQNLTARMICGIDTPGLVDSARTSVEHGANELGHPRVNRVV